MSKSSLFKVLYTSLTVVTVFTLVALATGAQKAATPAPKPAEATAPAATPAHATAPADKPTAADAKTETPAAAAPEATAKTEPSAADVAAYLEAYGWMVGQQAGFEMGFTTDEKIALMRGLERAASGEKAPENMKEFFPKMQEYLGNKEKAYRAAMMAKMAEEAKVNVAAGEKFMTDIAKQPGVQKTASGLYYKIETAGTGNQPSAEDVVTVHYTGKLTDGTVFDSSIERGTPIDLPLHGVIPGFSEGLQLLKEGGKATLYIPASLGYGNQAAGPIPAGSTLVFHVELIKIQPKPPAEAEKPEAEEEALKADAKPTELAK